MRIFILDDEINRYPRREITDILAKHDLTLATSCERGKAIYDRNYSLVLLDHDMEGFFESSDHPNTGYQFALWLVKQHVDRKPMVMLHSQNPTGRNNMLKLLIEHEFAVGFSGPFGPQYLQTLRKLYGTS